MAKLAWLAAILIAGVLSLIFWSTQAQIPLYSYEIVHVYPHDPRAFTQGLIYDQGYLYESTGLRGESSLRQVALNTGEVLKIQHLPPRYFGEGLTLRNNQLIQLTWQEHKGFIYDRQSFEIIKNFTYDTEGWGLTHDDTHLIMSDGSDILYFLDPITFTPVKQLKVRDRRLPITRLNELEYINGEIWANIWASNCIARIAPKTGKVNAWINLKGLRSVDLASNPNAVLNGIAYDPQGERLFVTGKLWPHLFEIKLTPASSGQICL